MRAKASRWKHWWILAATGGAALVAWTQPPRGGAAEHLVSASLTTSRAGSGTSSGTNGERLRPSPASERELAAGLDLARAELGDSGRYEAPLPGGRRAELTLDPTLQALARAALREYQIPYAAAVVMSTDGRVLALVGESALEPELGDADLALRPWAPAASVFKLVTATALVEAGVGEDTRVCYHGGLSGISEEHLRDDKRDRDCQSFAFGIGKSQNAIMGKLAARHLDGAALAAAAARLGWNAELPFALAVTPSRADLPSPKLDGELAFARVAAGFWRSDLSVLHGALLAETLANGGVMMMPRLIERVVGPGAAGAALPVAPAPRRVMADEVARAVGRMMVGTTTYGTARASFTLHSGAPALPYAVAGKTGSLSNTRTLADGSQRYINYNWFVGFAPADRPRVAIAVLVGNEPTWRVKAHVLARTLIQRALGDSAGEPMAARDEDHTP